MPLVQDVDDRFGSRSVENDFNATAGVPHRIAQHLSKRKFGAEARFVGVAEELQRLPERAPHASPFERVDGVQRPADDTIDRTAGAVWGGIGGGVVASVAHGDW
jgi:hypothetical protein